MQLISLHVNNNLLALDSSKVWSSSWRNRPTTTSQTKAQLVAVGPCCSVALWISMAARDWWSLGLGRKGKGSGCLCLCWIRGSYIFVLYYYVLVLCFLDTPDHILSWPKPSINVSIRPARMVVTVPNTVLCCSSWGNAWVKSRGQRGCCVFVDHLRTDGPRSLNYPESSQIQFSQATFCTVNKLKCCRLKQLWCGRSCLVLFFRGGALV